MKKIFSSLVVASLLVTNSFATSSHTISQDAIEVAKKDAKNTSQSHIVQEAEAIAKDSNGG